MSHINLFSWLKLINPCEQVFWELEQNSTRPAEQLKGLKPAKTFPFVITK